MPSYKDKEISRLRTELEEVRAAIRRLHLNGQQRNITGSHGVSEVAYSNLVKRENYLLGKIVAMQGGRNVTTPDYSGASTSP
jgi:hypothetical protein